ncbi:MAG: OBAP family protein [Thermoproteota archaeon]|nr:OBAP family protein [Thermoproteota archaeon]
MGNKNNLSARKKRILAGSFAVTTAALMMAVSALMFSIPLSNTAIAQQQQGMTNITAAAGKPVDGYNLPQGHLNAVRHNFDDPSLRMEHFCKPHDRIMMVCQLYDSNTENATLIGIEYIITQEQYDSLPNREKPYWHAHREELSPQRADPRMPELSPEQAQAEMAKLHPTWGKVIITWIPSDDLPSFPPQVQLVDHPFMVNATVSSGGNSTANATGSTNSSQ